MFRPVLALAAATTLTALVTTTAGFGPAHADDSDQAGLAHEQVVSADPVGTTPHVLDGRVTSIVQTGNTTILGGEFTKVASPDREQQYERTNLVAFDSSTGRIDPDFAPTTDGEVTAVAASPDGSSVYVGGMFDKVNGKQSRGVARLDLDDGSATEGFTPPTMNGRVKDMLLRDQKLWVAGTFGYIADKKQPALATLDPETGEFDGSNRVSFADPYRGGALQVLNIEIDAAGETLVAAGNFGTVEGQSRPQVAKLDIGGDEPTLSDWHTDFYAYNCSDNYHSYLRGVTIDPNGEYVAFSTTGGWQGKNTPCDAVARFELDESANQEPTWVNHSGGDTFDAIASTGAAIYAGGHFRWQNNAKTPTGHDAGPGAIERSGLAALDPENGLPYSWNPGRTLGVGVFDMLPTENGLWITSDTDRVGNWEYHGRVARFPLDGGTKPPESRVPELPGDVHTRASQVNGESTGKPQPKHPDAEVNRVLRPYAGDGFSGETAAPEGGLDWDAMHGSFMLGGRLYLAQQGEPLTARRFDGAEYGDPTKMNASDRLIVDQGWREDIANATGMTSVDGRIYYTLQGEDGLFYRGFNPQSGAVGVLRHELDTGSVSFGQAAGLFVDGEHLYWGSSADGKLRRATFVDGRLSSATAQAISEPGEDEMRWQSPVTFLMNENAGDDVNPTPPSATGAHGTRSAE